MRSKEELELAINEQEGIFRGVQERLSKLKQTYEDLVEMPERKAMVGKYFRCENSFGGERPSWWLYKKVTGVLEGSIPLSAVSFQKTCDEDMRVRLDDWMSMDSKMEEITKEEFLEAWYNIRAEMVLAVEGAC